MTPLYGRLQWPLFEKIWNCFFSTDLSADDHIHLTRSSGDELFWVQAGYVDKTDHAG